MSHLAILLLSVALLYILTAWAYVGYCYLRTKQRGAVHLQVTTSAFFVRPDQQLTTALNLKLDPKLLQTEHCIADICLLIDNSYSMQGEKLKQAQKSALSFIANSRVSADEVYIGVAHFNDEAAVLLPLSTDRSSLREVINNIPEPSGGTNMFRGLHHAGELLAESSRSRTSSLKQYIILLTDGETTDPEETLTCANQLKERGVNLFCIGIEDGNKNFLQQVAGESNSTGAEQAFYTDQPQQLVTLFENIRQVIESPNATNVTTSLKFNHQQLAYLSTQDDQRLVETDPMSWSIASLRPAGERIEFESSVVPCIGVVPINLEPIKLSFELENDGTQSDTEPARCAVIVIPFLPPSIFVSFVHPIFWNFLQRRYCPFNKSVLQRSQIPQFDAIPSVELPPTEERLEQPWRPTICIGLGGSGIAATLRLKSLLLDAKTTLGLEQVRFLNIDTDLQLPQRPMFGLAEFETDEFVGIGGDLWSEHCACVTQADRNPWYPHPLNGGLDRELYDTSKGCAGNRYLGRLSLHKFLRESDELQNRLEEMALWLAQCPSGLPKKVMIFCSTTGGTGSAIYMDIAHLLLSILERLNLEAQAVDLILPRSTIQQQPRFNFSISQANEMGFLLELERLKAIAGLEPDLADYPGVQPLDTPRFTHAEYFVNGSDNHTDAPFAAACFALSLINGSADLDAEIETHILSQQNPGASAAKAGIKVTVAEQSVPLYACERYIENSYLLEFLAVLEGICFGEDNKFHLTTSIQHNTAERQLELLFSSLPVDGHKEGLKTDRPFLFEYFAGLAKTDGANSDLDVLVGALENMPDLRNLMLRKDNLQTASVRLIEWVYEILRQDSLPRLSTAVILVREAESRLHQAAKNIQSKTINPTADVEVLLLFRADRLQQINRLIYDYIDITQAIAGHLQDWALLLGEGFSRSTIPASSAMAELGDLTQIGLARRYKRHQELASLAIEDYKPGDMSGFQNKLDQLCTQKIESVTDVTKKAIQSRFQWELTLPTTGTDKIHQLLIEQRLSPFVLQITDLEGRSKHFPPAPSKIQYLEAALRELVGYCQPWVSTTNEFDDISQSMEPRGPREKLSLNHQQGPAEFSRQATNIGLDLTSTDEYRQSLIYQPSEKNVNTARRGLRNHVLKPDFDATIIQRLCSRQRALELPAHPLVSYLTEDLHYLQRYLYLLLAGEVRQANHPESAEQVWIVEIENNKYYLGNISKGAEFSAAVQFVLKKKCLIYGKQISVTNDWRPDPEEVNALQELTSFDGDFLGQFKVLLMVMQDMGGYVHPFSQLTGEFFSEMLVTV